MFPDDLDPVLLARYFNGEGDEADVQTVRRWIAADPARAVMIERLREAWRIGGEKQPEWDVETALEAVRVRGRTAPVVVTPLPTREGRTPSLELLRPAAPRWRVAVLRIAAVIAIVVGAAFAWRARTSGRSEGRLEFVNTPLPQVLADLTRWYDYDFQLGDSTLANRRLTMSVQRETVSQILDVLETSLDVEWRQKGRTITLYPMRP